VKLAKTPPPPPPPRLPKMNVATAAGGRRQPRQREVPTTWGICKISQKPACAAANLLAVVTSDCVDKQIGNAAAAINDDADK